MEKILETHLRAIYSSPVFQQWEESFENHFEMWKKAGADRGHALWDQSTVVLISYGDSIRQTDKAPLETLEHFLQNRLKGLVSAIHILPFYPYSSDDGFSVIDYKAVNSELGNWSHVEKLARHFDLMFDLVLNHCSSQGEWFQKFLERKEPWTHYFKQPREGASLEKVFRPRALPLVHEFDSQEGVLKVWTTFSRDQVDLDFSWPGVLLEFLEILRFYIEKGARIIRLDAIAYLWKEEGTSCIHHPLTHRVVQFFRAVLDCYAPSVLLLTETNVPHKENISYFGQQEKEAHMVYQFTLPPLILDAFRRGQAGHLKQWAASWPETREDQTFFNFTASHDGIGVLPAQGYLTDEELNDLCRMVQQRGGYVSRKSTPEGEVPYELNISYVDAIAERTLPESVRARKFLCSQAIMLALAGVPGIYIHNLLGSENWDEGPGQTGMNRSINRKKLDFHMLENALADTEDLRHRIFEGFCNLLRIRRQHKAFHPGAPQSILKSPPEVFALMRKTLSGDETLLCLHNLSEKPVCMSLGEPLSKPDTRWKDLISGTLRGRADKKQKSCHITLFPWEILWLKESDS